MSLSGKSLAILGTITMTRLEVRQLAEKVGMTMTVGINKEYIIAGEGANPDQVNTAKVAGATIWTEAQFKKAIAQQELQKGKQKQEPAPSATAAAKTKPAPKASKKNAAVAAAAAADVPDQPKQQQTQQTTTAVPNLATAPSLSGKSLAFLGTITMLRLKARQLAEKFGMTKTVGINKEYIIAGEGANPDQVNTAKVAGATIWTEAEFKQAVAEAALLAQKKSRNNDNEANDDEEGTQPRVSKTSHKVEGKAVVLTKKTTSTSIFKGKTICFTGSLMLMKRDEAKKRAEAAGAKVTANVSGNTDIVVVGAKAGEKLDLAKQHGCKIMSEEEFDKKTSQGNDDDDDDDEEEDNVQCPAVDWDEWLSPLCPEPDFDNEILIEVESKLGYRLPRAYVALMKHSRNGGAPKKRFFHDKKSGLRTDVYTIYGISLPDDSEGYSIVEEQKYWLEEWEYPKIGVYFSMPGSGGHEMWCFSYESCGKQGEPTIVHIDQELDFQKTVVANNFTEFLGMLTEDEEEDD